eukprot:92508-Prorocentrum_minimum.AAC.1
MVSTLVLHLTQCNNGSRRNHSKLRLQYEPQPTRALVWIVYNRTAYGLSQHRSTQHHIRKTSDKDSRSAIYRPSHRSGGDSRSTIYRPSHRSGGDSRSAIYRPRHRSGGDSRSAICRPRHRSGGGDSRSAICRPSHIYIGPAGIAV